MTDTLAERAQTELPDELKPRHDALHFPENKKICGDLKEESYLAHSAPYRQYDTWSRFTHINNTEVRLFLLYL
jgi:hypothetical protein